MNTPSKGSSVCEEHIQTTTQFSNCLDEKEESPPNNENQGIMKILEIKETRHSKMYKVLWHTGEESWVRDEKIPENFQNKSVEIVEEVSFGQCRKVSRFKEVANPNEVNVNIIQSQRQGFAETSPEDTEIEEGGKKRKLTCSTDKSRHLPKNRKSAGKHLFKFPEDYSKCNTNYKPTKKLFFLGTSVSMVHFLV